MPKRLFLALLVGALVTMGIVAPAGAAQPLVWRRTELRPVGRQGMDYLLGVNDAGDASGYTYTSEVSVRPIIRYGTGALTVVDDPSFGSIGMLGRINSRGQAVGAALTPTDEPFPFVYDHGVVQRLPFEGTAIDITDDGSIGVTTRDMRPFVVGPGTAVRPLEVPAGMGGSVDAMGNGGWSAGYVAPPTGFWQPARWSPSGELSLLPLAPGAVTAQVAEVNRNGDVVGDMLWLPDGVHFHHLPVLWRNGVIQMLPTAGETEGAASSINDDGLIVGYFDRPDSTFSHSVVWENGRVVKVEDRSVPAASAWALTAVSPRGNLAGIARGDGGAVVYTRATGLLVRVSLTTVAALPPPVPQPIALDLFIPAPLSAVITGRINPN